MEFLVSEDNGGEYHWTIMAASGEALARSPNFASYEDAELAARRVRDDAGSARLEQRDGEGVPVDLVGRRASIRAAFDQQGRDNDSHPSAAVGVEIPAGR